MTHRNVNDHDKKPPEMDMAIQGTYPLIWTLIVVLIQHISLLKRKELSKYTLNNHKLSLSNK